MQTLYQVARRFEHMASTYQAVATKEPNVAKRAAIMREVAHYLECAARLRGGAVAPVGLGRRKSR